VAEGADAYTDQSAAGQAAHDAPPANAFDKELKSVQAQRPNWRRRPAPRALHFGVFVIFAVVGIYFAITGYNRWAQVQPVAGGKTTTGTVVSVVQGQSCGRYSCTPNWTPTIRFRAADGNAYSFVGPTGGQIETGDTVNVSYSPSDPNVAHDVSGSGTNGLIVLGVGVFAAVLGIGLFVVGLEAVQRRIGLTTARGGSGWVGHIHIHSNTGAVAALAVLVAVAVVGFVIL
jgi:hypothetical protein